MELYILLMESFCCVSPFCVCVCVCVGVYKLPFLLSSIRVSYRVHSRHILRYIGYLHFALVAFVVLHFVANKPKKEMKNNKCHNHITYLYVAYIKCKPDEVSLNW